jgi:hypothetical protein
MPGFVTNSMLSSFPGRGISSCLPQPPRFQGDKESLNEVPLDSDSSDSDFDFVRDSHGSAATLDASGGQKKGKRSLSAAEYRDEALAETIRKMRLGDKKPQPHRQSQAVPPASPFDGEELVLVEVPTPPADEEPVEVEAPPDHQVKAIETIQNNLAWRKKVLEKVKQFGESVSTGAGEALGKIRKVADLENVKSQQSAQENASPMIELKSFRKKPSSNP